MGFRSLCILALADPLSNTVTLGPLGIILANLVLDFMYTPPGISEHPFLTVESSVWYSLLVKVMHCLSDTESVLRLIMTIVAGVDIFLTNP